MGWVGLYIDGNINKSLLSGFGSRSGFLCIGSSMYVVKVFEGLD
jgi:hypothetical protein